MKIKKEFRMKQQPLWIYIITLVLIGVMVYFISALKDAGWVFFVVPVVMYIRDLRTKYVLDGEMFYVRRLFKGRRIPVSDIQKLWILGSGRIQLFHHLSSFIILDPKDRDEFISALKEANSLIEIEKK